MRGGKCIVLIPRRSAAAVSFALHAFGLRQRMRKTMRVSLKKSLSIALIMPSNDRG